MRWRNTLILLAVLVALGLYVWFYERGTSGEEAAGATAEPTVAPVVLSFDPQGVRSLLLARPATGQQTGLLYDKAEQAWYVQGEAPVPADDSMVSLLVSYLSDLTAQRVLTGTLDALASYGLDPAEMVVTVVLESGQEAVVEIGAETLAGTAHYARVPGREEVYTISSYVGDNVARFIDTPPYQPTATPTMQPTPEPAMTPAATGTPPTPGSTAGASPSAAPASAVPAATGTPPGTATAMPAATPAP